MSSQDPLDRHLARRARNAALIMALAMMYWMAAQFLGSRLNWNPYFAFALDIGAIIALLWALWIVWQVYQARKAKR